MSATLRLSVRDECLHLLKWQRAKSDGRRVTLWGRQRLWTTLQQPTLGQPACEHAKGNSGGRIFNYPCSFYGWKKSHFSLRKHKILINIRIPSLQKAMKHKKNSAGKFWLRFRVEKGIKLSIEKNKIKLCEFFFMFTLFCLTEVNNIWDNITTGVLAGIADVASRVV